MFPSESSDLPLSSILNSPLVGSKPTPGPTPTNTQFEWLNQTSLIFSSISESVSDSLSLTDPDQVPKATLSRLSALQALLLVMLSSHPEFLLG